MCGFLGWSNVNCIDRLLTAIPYVSWRGTITGFWCDAVFSSGMFASRLPRTGNRSRPQPVVTGRGLVLTLNGQIYRGLQTPSSLPVGQLSDTEQLAFVLSELPSVAARINLLQRICGEYSIAILDIKSRELILARDAFGTKPLYFATARNGVTFGSSARGVAALLHGSFSISGSRVRDVLEFGVTECGTVVDAVSSVGPGEVIAFNARGRTSHIRPPHFSSSRRSIEATLQDGVTTRSVNQSAYIAYSGGVDSSLIRSFAPMTDCLQFDAATMSIVHDDPRRCNLTRYHTTPLELLEMIERSSKHLERPLCNLSSTIMALLSKVGRSLGFEVQLSGEGADEVFFGYNYYFARSGHGALLPSSNAFQLFHSAFFGDLPPPSPLIVAAAAPDATCKELVSFDRAVRLPNHLMAIHSDLPCLLNSIESRTPFIEFVDNLWSRETPPTDGPPKLDLKALLRSRTSDYTTAASKSGLFCSPTAIGAENVVELAQLVEKKSALAQSRFANRVQLAVNHSGERAAPPALQGLRTFAFQAVLQLATLHLLSVSATPAKKMANLYTMIDKDISILGEIGGGSNRVSS